MSTETKETPVATAHPLITKEISDFGAWGEWEEAWQGTSDPKRLLGLLQFGFDVLMNEWNERGREEMDRRLCTYLDLADGHGDEENFGSQPDTPGYHLAIEKMSGRQLKRVIARKAFEVLCLRFFKDTNVEKVNRLPSWAPQIIRPAVFEKILWFFRLEGGVFAYDLRIHNLKNVSHIPSSKDYHLALARKFAFDLCKFAFEFQCLGKSSNEMDDAAREMFNKARRDLTTLLLGLRQERFLLNTSGRFEVGEAEMETLQSVVLSEERWDGAKHQKCSTVEEAFALGSRAAEILILLRTRKQELDRLREIRDAKQAAEEADRKVEKLERSPTS